VQNFCNETPGYDVQVRLHKVVASARGARSVLNCEPR